MKTLGKILVWCLVIVLGLIFQFTPFMVLIALPFAVLSVKRKLPIGLAAYAAAFALFWLFASRFSIPWRTGTMNLGVFSLLWAGVCLFPVLTAVGVLRARRNWRNSVLSISLAFVLSFLAAGAAVWAITKKMPVDYLMYSLNATLKNDALGAGFCAYRDYFLRLFEMAQQATYGGTVPEEMMKALLDPLTKEQVVSLADSFTETYAQALSNSLPFTVITWSLFGGTFVWIFGVKALQKEKLPTVALPDFTKWSLSRKTPLALVILAVIGFVLALFGISGMQALYMTSAQLFLLLFRVQGLAFLNYLLERGRIGTGGRIALCILAFLIVPHLLSLAGMVELMFSIRKILDMRKA